MVSANRKVAIIIPCRNEEKSIATCLDSLLTNGYEHDAMEIVVIDGMSDDTTRAIVRQYQERHVFIRLIDNHRRIHTDTYGNSLTALTTTTRTCSDQYWKPKRCQDSCRGRLLSLIHTALPTETRRIVCPTGARGLIASRQWRTAVTVGASSIPLELSTSISSAARIASSTCEYRAVEVG